MNNLHKNDTDKLIDKLIDNCGFNPKSLSIGINTSNTTYCNQYFRDAPALEKITEIKINGFDYNNIKSDQLEEVCDDLCYYIVNNKLHILIGNYLKNKYNKTDKTQQSIYTTDLSRLNYTIILFDSIIKNMKNDSFDILDENELDVKEEPKKKGRPTLQQIKDRESKKEKTWIVDKKGQILTKLIIKPIVKKIKDILKEYCGILSESITKKNKKVTDDDRVKFESCNKLINEFDTMKILDDVNRYIAPEFNLIKSLIKN